MTKTIRTEEYLNEIIQKLDDIKWSFSGFDKSNYEFLFLREDSTWIDVVAIGWGTLGTSRRRKSNKIPLEFEPFTFNRFEFPLFLELYNHMLETRRGLPLTLAKRQKELDRMFKFECGETYATFENGVLSCGVLEDDE